MASRLLSVLFEDVAGTKATFSVWIEGTYSPADPEVLAFIQSWRNLSQAKILEALVGVPVDLTTMTNPAASGTGSYDRVRDQAVLQLRRNDNTGNLSMTVPAPLDAIFQASGEYQGQSVDPAAALIVAFKAAAITEPVLATPQDGPVSFSKGWRKGQPHP